MQLQEAPRVPNKLDPRRTTPRYIISKMPKVNDKGRILKAAREKQLPKGHPHKTVRFLKRNFAGQKRLARYSQSHEKQRPTAKIALPSKVII